MGESCTVSLSQALCSPRLLAARYPHTNLTSNHGSEKGDEDGDEEAVGEAKRLYLKVLPQDEKDQAALCFSASLSGSLRRLPC